MLFPLRLFRLGGWAGGSIADGVFRHGRSFGVLHGLPNNVGHAVLLGSAIGVLLGSLLVDVLGLKRAVHRQTRSRASSATRQRKPFHNPTSPFSTDQERKSTRRVQYISDPNDTANASSKDIPASIQFQHPIVTPIMVTRERHEKGLGKMSEVGKARHGMCCKHRIPIRCRTRGQIALFTGRYQSDAKREPFSQRPSTRRSYTPQPGGGGGSR